MIFSKQECIEAALCLRIGAIQNRKDAAAQQSLPVKQTLENSARYREELAEKFDRAAK